MNVTNSKDSANFKSAGQALKVFSALCCQRDGGWCSLVEPVSMCLVSVCSEAAADETVMLLPLVNVSAVEWSLSSVVLRYNLSRRDWSNRSPCVAAADETVALLVALVKQLLV